MTNVILIILAVLVVAVVLLYNRLVTYKNRVKEASADIDVQLKRRANLIPNLVEAVKGYMGHERETLEKVVELRSKILEGQNSKEKLQADNMLTDALKSVFAVAEQYPDLKANQNFLELQRELTDAEDKIQAARRFYNSNVREYNTALEMFPTNLIASLFKFKPAEFYEIEDEKDREVVNVSFKSNNTEK